MKTVMRNANAYGALTLERLTAFEREIGIVLPQEYRTFLLQHNGGVPEPACFNALDDPEFAASETSERPIACFFALHDWPWNDNTLEGARAYPLQEAWRDFRAEAEDTSLFPIGADVSGSYLCVRLTGPEQGHIFLEGHETEILQELATSLSAFFDALHECTMYED